MSHRLAALSFTGLVMTLAIGCGGSAGAADDGEADAESLKSPCGVVVVRNRTDDNYCGFIKVQNNGAITVDHWTVDAELPAGVKVDYLDGGLKFEQTGTHVRFTPDTAHATLGPKASYEITYCNSNAAKLLAIAPTAKSELCTAAPTPAADDAGTPSTDASTPPTSDAGPPPATDGGTDSGSTTPATKSPLGKYVVTWYSFQDNTPVNSSLSASGRKLIPYISVAVPFRLLKPFGGKMNYGDKLYIDFLHGRTMPNGLKHSGWVQIDDYCGDGGDDSYCFQDVGGTKYPNTDLYIGDFTKSGMSPSACSGPAGSGQELTSVSTGDAGSEWIGDYGGRALGTGKCGDISTAKPQQGSCWDYTPPASSASDCATCTSASCTSW